VHQAAAGPEKAEVIADLPQQLVLTGGSGPDEPCGPLLTVSPQGEDLADLSGADPFMQLPAGAAMAAHQTHTDFEVFLLRLFAELDDSASGRAVHGNRLFHEDMESLLDRVAEMDPAEGNGCGQDRHIAGP
jgi:hypothetical protein